MSKWYLGIGYASNKGRECVPFYGYNFGADVRRKLQYEYVLGPYECLTDVLIARDRWEGKLGD